MPAAELLLYIPGLLDLLGLFRELPARERPSLAMLERFLARARQERFAPSEPERGLLQLFGIPVAAEHSAPVAPFTHLIDTDTSHQGVLMRADPVFLQADRQRLVMLGHGELGLTEEQAGRLADDITAHFAADWRLRAPHPERWYIELDAEPDLFTVPPSRVLEQDVNTYLPQGADGARWRGVLNEVQMLLHDHPVNIERESHAQVPVNSIWLWGNGRLPAAGEPVWQRVCGDDVLLQGLARWSGCDRRSLGEGAAEGLLQPTPEGRILVYFADVWRKWCERDVYGGRDWWQAFQADWLEPLLAAVRTGRLASLQLVAGHGVRFHLSRSHSRRWWKRRYPALYRAEGSPGVGQ